MKSIGYRLLLVLMFSFISGTAVANSAKGKGDHIEVELISEFQSLSPDTTNWIGIKLSPDPHWHTYWRNPGDSGEPPTVEWQSSAELQFGEFLWPLPQIIPVAHLVNYGYEGETLLMLPVTLPPNITLNEQVEIKAALSWLVCKEDCIPGWADLTITLPIANTSQPTSHATLFESTRKTLPQQLNTSSAFELTEDHITLSFTAPYQSDNWQVLPFSAELIQHNQEQTFINDGDETNAVLAKSDYFAGQNSEINYLLTDGKKGFYVSAVLNNMQPENTSSILLLVVMALLGGLILNLMPCVLPVLSIKAMAATQNDMSHKEKIAYGVGVITTFNLFALIILLLKQTGESVGWGFHMQEPGVVAFLAFLFVFIALLFIDIAPSGARFSGIGQSLTAGNSATSQFMTGVLAVVVASPCTAPFMAAALGVALVSSTSTMFIIFNALAIGFALPLTLLFMSKRFMYWLPKPGVWMDTFKQLLVFPMLATVVWLVWVYLSQTSSAEQLLLLSALLLFSFLIWLSKQLKAWMSVSAVMLALIVFGYVVTKPTTLQQSTSIKVDSSAFSETKLQSLKDDNQIVLVNMTADWCITCKVNEQVAFSSDEFDDLMAEDKVHYLVGDWTNKNEQILNYLQQYERSGVPLYVVYAGNVYEQVLPQLLTTNMVIEAINQAKEELNP